MLQEAIVNILINKMKAQYDLDHYVIAEKHIKKDSIKIKFVLGTVSNTVERKKVSNGNIAYYNILDKSYREQVTENRLQRTVLYRSIRTEKILMIWVTGQKNRLRHYVRI